MSAFQNGVFKNLYIEFSIIVFPSSELPLIKRICSISLWYTGIENKKKRNTIGSNYLRAYSKPNDMSHYRIFTYKLLNTFTLLLNRCVNYSIFHPLKRWKSAKWNAYFLAIVCHYLLLNHDISILLYTSSKNASFINSVCLDQWCRSFTHHKAWCRFCKFCHQGDTARVRS